MGGLEGIMRGSGEEPSSKLQSDFNTRQRDLVLAKAVGRGYVPGRIIQKNSLSLTGGQTPHEFQSW